MAVAPAKDLHEALQLFLAFHMGLSCLVGGAECDARADGPVPTTVLQKGSGRGQTHPPGSGRVGGGDDADALAALRGGCHGLPEQEAHPEPLLTLLHYARRRESRWPRAPSTNFPACSSTPAGWSEFRDPSLSIRYFAGIDREFWGKAVALMRDGLPVFSYNDASVLAAQKRLGVSDELARDYAHCACLLCVLPGRDLPPSRENHNGPLAVLLAINGGVEPMAGNRIGEATPPPEAMGDFESFFDAFRRQMHYSLAAAAAQHRGRGQGDRSFGYPLLARPLLDGGLRVPVPAATWSSVS